MPKELGWYVIAITLAVIGISVLANRLIPRRYFVAIAVWELGFAGAVTLALLVFRRPEIAFFYALLPLMAVVTAGWLGGLLAEGLVIGLVYGLARSSLVQPWPPFTGLSVVVGGAFTGVLGGAATRSLLTAIEWYLYSYTQAREKMDEARGHKGELEQTLENLTHANG